MLDYVILAVVAIVGIGGGLFTLHEAKKFKEKRNKQNEVAHERA